MLALFADSTNIDRRGYTGSEVDVIDAFEEIFTSSTGRIIVAAFASSIAEVSEWLHNHGPVVIGVDWYYGMEDVDASGFVHLTNGVAGGHCVILRQDRGSISASLGRNSWGAWGIGNSGDFLISDADLAKLLAANGDFLLAAEVPL